MHSRIPSVWLCSKELVIDVLRKKPTVSIKLYRNKKVEIRRNSTIRSN